MGHFLKNQKGTYITIQCPEGEKKIIQSYKFLKDNFKKIGGNIRMRVEEGKGMTYEIDLPKHMYEAQIKDSLEAFEEELNDWYRKVDILINEYYNLFT